MESKVSLPDAPRHPLNTLWWNRCRYTFWAPTYDSLVTVFNRARHRAFELLALQPGERLLIAGAGTGLDLPFIPAGVRVTAVDLTPAMLKRLQARAEKLGLPVDARVMNIQDLEFADASFDAVVLHLVVAVVPDPIRCLREAERVLKPGGRISLMDKFLPPKGWVRHFLQLTNPILGLFSSEANRELAPIVAATRLVKVHEEPAVGRGWFRLVMLRKPER
ncbi:methyltransferase domain-containing protein [Fontisphaera persica]|uniref:class I SAM-dependent methyltransferase n=1 Tax=Fontisphaera persica TaxID=2974023 RepID=UPI0024BFAD9A|nr:methyltransferase domain-containing protein [Fontisphaera persica]WCJ61139.1 methyltransferase domain-containing protein [Fontisphaera persica]